VFPYLLRGLAITQPNQVWAMDLTYLPMRHGFLYLVVVLDWATRRVLAWRLSNTMTTDVCLDALESAIRACGCPGILNTDQGSQFMRPSPAVLRRLSQSTRCPIDSSTLSPFAVGCALRSRPPGALRFALCALCLLPAASCSMPSFPVLPVDSSTSRPIDSTRCLLPAILSSAYRSALCAMRSLPSAGCFFFP